jgi:hypothetical protein
MKWELPCERQLKTLMNVGTAENETLVARSSIRKAVS